jgi:transposase-like protein
MVALALFLYTRGLSTRQVARVLEQLGVKVCHVAGWGWVPKYSQRVDPKALWTLQAPQTLIVYETVLQLGRQPILALLV